MVINGNSFFSNHFGAAGGSLRAPLKLARVKRDSESAQGDGQTSPSWCSPPRPPASCSRPRVRPWAPCCSTLS